MTALPYPPIRPGNVFAAKYLIEEVLGEGAMGVVVSARHIELGKRFAIILDGKYISAPVINGPIQGGSGQITGNFTAATANDLAVLRWE